MVELVATCRGGSDHEGYRPGAGIAGAIFVDAVDDGLRVDPAAVTTGNPVNLVNLWRELCQSLANSVNITLRYATPGFRRRFFLPSFPAFRNNDGFSRGKPPCAWPSTLAIPVKNRSIPPGPVARCVDYCDRLGYRVVDVFRDESVSGEYTTARDELDAMMVAALEGTFERVVAEDLSRLSRGRNDVSHPTRS